MLKNCISDFKMRVLWDFIKKYYIDSIVYKQGYNPVNTITWLALLIVILILLYRFLKNRVKIDEKFVLSSSCYVILGSVIRVLEDCGYFKPPVSYLLMSPMIFFLIFAFAFPTLVISLKAFRENYWKSYFLVPLAILIVVLIITLINLKVTNWWILPCSLTLALLSLCGYIILVSKITSLNFMNDFLSKLAFLSGMLDGWATFIALSFFNYSEIHVIPKILVSAFGPRVIPIIKAAVFFSALYLINKTEEQESNFLKFVLIVFGLGPGLRNSLRVTFGV